MDKDSQLLSEAYLHLNQKQSNSNLSEGFDDTARFFSNPRPLTPEELAAKNKAELKWYHAQLNKPDGPIDSKDLMKVKTTIARDDIERTALDFATGENDAHSNFNSVAQLTQYYNQKANFFWKLHNAKSLEQIRTQCKIPNDEWFDILDRAGIDVANSFPVGNA